MPKFNLNWVYFLILGALAFLYFSGVGGGSSVDREVDYTTFKSYVSKGYAKRMEVNKGDGTLKMFVDGKHIRDVFGQDSKSTGKAPTVTTKNLLTAKRKPDTSRDMFPTFRTPTCFGT